jgi:hypothetical protein
MKYIITVQRFRDIEVNAETADEAFDKVSKLINENEMMCFAKFIKEVEGEQKEKTNK